MFQDLPEGQTHSERYTVKKIEIRNEMAGGGFNSYDGYEVHDANGGFTVAQTYRKEWADLIARALNAYAALEQVKSIGKANVCAPPKEKEE